MYVLRLPEWHEISAQVMCPPDLAPLDTYHVASTASHRPNVLETNTTFGAFFLDKTSSFPALSPKSIHEMPHVTLFLILINPVPHKNLATSSTRARHEKRRFPGSTLSNSTGTGI